MATAWKKKASKAKQLGGKYLQSRLRIFHNLRPKGLWDYVLGGAFLMGFCYTVQWHVAVQAVIPWQAVWIVIVAVFLLIPQAAIEPFYRLPGFLRGVMLSLGCYVSVVLLGHAIDLKNFAAVWEILTCSQGAPFTGVHGVGLIGAVYFFRMQTAYGSGQKEKPAETLLVRGPELISLEKAREIANKARAQNPSEPTIEWGCLNIPISRGTENFLLVGNSGSGKSISLTRFLTDLLDAIRPGANKRLMIYDAKRDVYPVLERLTFPGIKIKLLNPFDVRGYAWDVARDLQTASEQDQHNLPIELAAIILPNHDGSHPFFPRAGQALLGGIIEALQYLTEENKGDRWTLRDVVLAMRNQTRMRVILEESHQTLKHLSEVYLGNTEQDKGVAATLENELRRISYIAAAWDQAREKKQMLSLKNWLKEESIAVLGSDPESETTIKQINDILFKRLVQLVRLQEEASTEKVPRQTWFMVDELRHSGRLPGLEILLTFGRSKGACCVLAFQDIPGLAHNYGADRLLSQELVGACENKGFLRTTDEPTQEFASKQFGEHEVELPRHGTSKGTSDGPGGRTESSGESFHYQRTTQRLILGSQFASDLPRPSKEEKRGIRGYYQTTLVHHPYLGEITSEEIDTGYVAPMEHVPAFLARPPSHLILEDWTMEDLERLRLAAHAEKLGVKTDDAGPKVDFQAPTIPKPPAQDWRNVTS